MAHQTFIIDTHQLALLAPWTPLFHFELLSINIMLARRLALFQRLHIVTSSPKAAAKKTRHITCNRQLITQNHKSCFIDRYPLSQTAHRRSIMVGAAGSSAEEIESLRQQVEDLRVR